MLVDKEDNIEHNGLGVCAEDEFFLGWPRPRSVKDACHLEVRSMKFWKYG